MKLWILVCLIGAPRAETQSEDSLESIVGTLSSDSPSVRDEGCRRLKKLGVSVIPKLEDLLKSQDLNLRRTASQLISEIKAEESLRWYSPTPKTITFVKSNVPVEELLTALSHSFEIELKCKDNEVRNKMSSLSLRDATLWVALAHLERATDCHVDEGIQSQALSLVRTSPLPYRARLDRGNCRVLVTGPSQEQWPGDLPMLVFNVDVLLPARDWAESYEISNLEVTTSVGKKVDAKVAVSPKGAICLREVRKPSRMVGLEVTMRESDLNPDDSITLSGNLALHRSTAVELLKETLPTSDWELPGLRCSASWDANARVHVVETSATDLKEMTAFQVSALDLNNDWLYEFEPFRFAPCAFHQTSRKITGVEKEPSKIRIWKSLSIRKEEIAFKFEKIPVR